MKPTRPPGTRVSVLESPFAAGAILAAAERLDVDAIALASHGPSGVGRLFLGHPRQETDHSLCPLPRATRFGARYGRHQVDQGD